MLPLLDNTPLSLHDPPPMNCLAIAIDFPSGLPLIVSAGVALYVASKSLSDALVGGSVDSPGKLAIGQWLPIAVLAVLATNANRLDIAVGLIFSSSVACLSLALGSSVYLSASPVNTPLRRTWAMLVPATLLAFLAGFRGTISLFNAAVIALQGLCVLLLWNDHTAEIQPFKNIIAPGRGMMFRTVQFFLGLAVACVGSWLALHGIDRAAAHSEVASAGLMTATLLSPLLVLPIIGTGTELAHRNQASTAIASDVGMALLNTCGLLPLVVLTAFIRQWIDSKFSWFTFLPVPFPLAVWRVDVILVIALGLFLLPVSMGRWSLGKTQGMFLMLGYGIYLALAILMGVRKV